MSCLHQTLSTVFRDESGQDLIEYALLGCVIALGAIASIHGVATALGTVFSKLGTTLTTAV